MGTKMAPTYANLTLGYLERKLYSELEKKGVRISALTLKKTGGLTLTIALSFGMIN